MNQKLSGKPGAVQTASYSTIPRLDTGSGFRTLSRGRCQTRLNRSHTTRPDAFHCIKDCPQPRSYAKICRLFAAPLSPGAFARQAVARMRWQSCPHLRMNETTATTASFGLHPFQSHDRGLHPVGRRVAGLRLHHRDPEILCGVARSSPRTGRYGHAPKPVLPDSETETLFLAYNETFLFRTSSPSRRSAGKIARISGHFWLFGSMWSERRHQPGQTAFTQFCGYLLYTALIFQQVAS